MIIELLLISEFGIIIVFLSPDNNQLSSSIPDTIGNLSYIIGDASVSAIGTMWSTWSLLFGALPLPLTLDLFVFSDFEFRIPFDTTYCVLASHK